MAGSFHESYAHDEVPLPSDRSTGLVLAAACLIGAYALRRNEIALYGLGGLGGLLALTSIAAPALLRPLNIAWMKLAMLLNKIVSPVIMLLLFAVAILPFGLLMQLKRDPLRKARRPAGTASYWIPREKSHAEASMKNQF